MFAKPSIGNYGLVYGHHFTNLIYRHCLTVPSDLYITDMSTIIRVYTYTYVCKHILCKEMNCIHEYFSIIGGKQLASSMHTQPLDVILASKHQPPINTQLLFTT